MTRLFLRSRSSSCLLTRQVRYAVKEGLLLAVPMQGMLDSAKEIERLTKQHQKLLQEAQGLQKRLASDGFRAKAPAAIVEKAQMELQELEDKLTVIDAQRGRLVPAAPAR